MNVKQSDIAAKLGISRVTVTKALQDSPDISKGMKKKVKKIAEKTIFDRKINNNSLILI